MPKVYGTYTDPTNDRPASGHIDFRLKPAGRNVAGDQLTRELIRAWLDGNGFFAIDLYPTVLVDNVTGVVVYEVQEHVTGLERRWDVAIGLADVDLPSRYPGDVSTGVVVPVPGPSGPSGPSGPPGVGTGGPMALDDLTDVDTVIVPPISGQVLVYENGIWVPGASASGILIDDTGVGPAPSSTSQIWLSTSEHVIVNS